MSQKDKVSKLRRYKVVDTGRGMAIFGMVIGHMLNWWLTEQDFWLYDVFSIWIASFGTVVFIFISGASATLSLKRRYMGIEEGDQFLLHLVRNVYFLRAFFLLIIAIIYNIAVALIFQDPTWIWAWNFLQTIAISLFLTWPLIKTSKIFRTIIGILVLIVNEFILALLLPYQGQTNSYGIAFYLLYNPLDLYIILPYFSMFLLGTVLGDILHDLSQIEDPEEMKSAFKPHLTITLILGIILVIVGIFFIPDFERHASLASMTYSLGLLLVFYTGLIYLEIFEPIKFKKKYRIFYFYNFYSFTIYLAHDILFLIFYRQLTVITIWIPMIITMFILSILIYVIFRKIGAKASLKFGISVISFVLATNREERKMLLSMSKNSED